MQIILRGRDVLVPPANIETRAGTRNPSVQRFLTENVPGNPPGGTRCLIGNYQRR